MADVLHAGAPEGRGHMVWISTKPKTVFCILSMYVCMQCLDYAAASMYKKKLCSSIVECLPGCQVFHILQYILETLHLLVSIR